VTGFTELARANPAAFNGPRSGFLWQLEGTLNGGDITVTFGVLCEEAAIYLVDWADAKTSKPFIHAVASGSMANASTRTVHHQRRAHASNALCGFLFNGDGNNATTSDEGTELQTFNFNPGLSSGQLVWKASDFTAFKIDWTWTTSISNLALVFEVQDPLSDDGGKATFLDTSPGLVNGPSNDVGGNVTTGAFTPLASDVIIFDLVGERNPPIQPTSVIDSLGNNYAEIGHVDDPGGIHRLWRYAFRYVTAPGSTTITFTLATLLGSVFELITLRGTTGITNTDFGGALFTNVAASTTSLAIDMGGIGDHSGVLATFAKDSVTEDFVLEDGWINPDLRSENRVGFGSETECILMAWLGGDEDTIPSITTGTAANLAGMAQEIFGPQAKVAAYMVGMT